MTERKAPTLTKVPFVAGDILLVLAAVFLASRGGAPLDWRAGLLVTACVAFGACLAVWPFLAEYRAALKFAEADRLATAVEQLNRVQALCDQIALAMGHWQNVQTHSTKTVTAAKEIADRITTEAQAFSDFIQKANDVEKNHLRLEVDKLRRGEGQWVELVIHLLDHVYALHQAGLRTGQRPLIEQLTRFQNACRDVVRRVGLMPILPTPGTPYDEKAHQLMEGAVAKPGDPIQSVLACGYTLQGQPIRPPLVAVQTATQPGSDDAQLSFEQNPPVERS